MCAAIAADAASSAEEVRADKVSNCTGHKDSDGSLAGASSNTTWALEPPIPKELTPARRGPSREFQGLHASLTKNGLFAKSICGLGSRKFRDAGMVRCSRASTVLMRPATPAAASKWPILLFTDPIAQKRFLSVETRKARSSAAISIG